MAERLKATRIDFTIAGEIVLVNKVDDQTRPMHAVVVESTQYPKANLDNMLAWCEKNGWVVRRYLPLGARAWKGSAPRAVRTAGQIRKKRSQLTKYPIEGLQAHTLDLLYDC